MARVVNLRNESSRSSVILIPKQLRMDWTDVLMLDPTLSASDVRVAGIIGMHFGNKSGLAYLTLEAIAAALKPDVAGGRKPDVTTAKRAVANLEQRGYLIVRRRQIGTRSYAGKVIPVYGGKGGKGANEYLPAIGSIQITALDRGVNLASRATALWENAAKKLESKQGAEALLSSAKQGVDALLSDNHSSAFKPPKQGVGALPTLASPSEKNSSRAREPSATGSLGSFGAELCNRIDPAQFRSWFAGRVEVGSNNPPTAVLVAASKFIRDEIVTRFEGEILAAMRAINPTIANVVITVKGQNHDRG